MIPVSLTILAGVAVMPVPYRICCVMISSMVAHGTPLIIPPSRALPISSDAVSARSSPPVSAFWIMPLSQNCSPVSPPMLAQETPSPR